MLAVNQLTFAYDKARVLSDVSFSVEPGVFAALLGPNGAGKSTLLSLMTGQYSVPPGTVHIAGQDLADNRAAALQTLGIVFQSPTLDLDLTIGQNLSYFGGLHGLSSVETERRIQPWLERVDLQDRHDHKVRTLSGGQRRRVEIVRALIHDPKILLLDEPTTGLDVPTRDTIVNLVHELSTQNGICVLWATHLVDEIRPTDELIVLQKGRVIAAGSYDHVLEQRQTHDLSAIAGGTQPENPESSPK